MENNMIDILLGRQAPGPKAHDQMDALIGQNEIQNLLTGSSYETDPDILRKHSTLLNYLSEMGDNNVQMTPELEGRMGNIAKFPSFESRGKTRYTAPITTPGSYPPEVTQESRSMQDWLQDYDYLHNRTALSKP